MAATDIDAIVRDNLQRVRDRIAEACHAAGRSADEVTLVGVSKYVRPAETRALVDAGCQVLGEARPQQLWEKAEASELAGHRIAWRLIGHLQRNKVSRTLRTGVACLESVDSRRLLETINASLANTNRRQPILIEVNASGDDEKHGFSPDEVPGLIAELGQYPGVEVQGLMTMAARQGGVDRAREDFASLRRLREQVATAETPLTHLSMGMSGDFEQAILEGATHVRIGSALWEGLR